MTKKNNFTEIYLNTSDNEKIAVNHYDSGRESVLIIAHGWCMCKDSIVFKSMSEDFSKNIDVLTMDFRGHGRSSGVFTFTAKEPEDLNAVINFAKTRYKKIGLMGFSLGGAISLIHAAKHNNIDSLITVSAPVSFDKIENHFYKKEAYIPTIEKFELWRCLSVRPGNILQKKINPIDVVENIVCAPILFMTGGKDPTVHPWHSEALYQRACSSKTCKQSSFSVFDENFHAEDLYIRSHEKFMHTCNHWFSTLSSDCFIEV